MLSARQWLVKPEHGSAQSSAPSIVSQAIQERLFGHLSPNYRVPPW
jgi:hypothetical protein